ncbi:MAG: phosphoenolpyruvate carboxykinase (ATP) [bacterium]
MFPLVHRKDATVALRRQESISQSLASKAVPQVQLRSIAFKKQPRHVHLPQSPRSRASMEAKQPEALQDMFHDMGDVGLKPVNVYHNLTTAELYEHALKYEKSSHITSTGALATLSGAKTGRSPRDKRVVKDPASQDDIWWGEGSPNFEMDEQTFKLNRERAVDYLNMLDRIYVLDAFAGWEAGSRLKIRVVCGRPYHALFMFNMLVRPTEEELAEFGTPDFTIYNAGAFPANRYTSFMTSPTSIDVSLEHKEMVILGTQVRDVLCCPVLSCPVLCYVVLCDSLGSSVGLRGQPDAKHAPDHSRARRSHRRIHIRLQYAGEMKKGVFSLMNYWLPKRGILSLHSGANVGAAGDVTMFFGLSGTGKTTLSADASRPLIGDDEHGWGDRGVFNIEGGCYAKAIGLKAENEPEIFNAIKFGTVLENVVFDDDSRVVDYDASTITENTRASYPIEYIDNAHIPCLAGHPKNIIMLCCDAFGVLPPVAKLTKEQAMYYFISGYTAKVAGTEQGVTEPEATFSACFGSAFLMWHPAKYASMLADKMEAHGTSAWLINTGWTGGAFGTGSRFKLKHTRAIVHAIHSGELERAEYETMPVFRLQVPKGVTGVPSEALMPKNAWVDKENYDATLEELAALFKENFAQFRGGDGHLGVDLSTYGPL